MITRNRSFLQSTAAFLVVGLVALLGIVGTTIWLGARAQDYFTDVLQSRDIRSAAVETRNALLSAETSQRGFMVTNNEAYLAPYDGAKSLTGRQLDVLKALLDDPTSERSLARLGTVLDEKFREMDETIVLKRAGRHDEALTLIRSDLGKALTDEANAFLAGIIVAADTRLTASVGEERANAALLRSVSIFGGIIIVIVVGGAALAALRYTRALNKARGEVEQRVSERTSELARANDEIRRFAHIVSHDLRAPLVNIMGFTSELKASVESIRAQINRTDTRGDRVAEQARIAVEEDLPEAIQFISSSTTKMNGLITAILKLSREGQRRLAADNITLRDLIEAGAHAIQHQLTEADGEIALDIGVPSIVSDRLSLEQVFGNLLDNAVKYRAKDRPLRIRVETKPLAGDRVEIDVQDNGRGIGERDVTRVFDLFKRAGQQDQPGEGIGLAYVQTLVSNLGGTIDLTSELGRGTTFRIVLPQRLPGVAAS